MSRHARRERGRIFSAVALSVTFAWLAAGCQTAGSANAQPFTSAVSAARANVNTTFTALAEQTRGDAVERAIANGKLSEEGLAGVPNAAVVATWNSVFDAVEGYATQLAAFSGGKAGTDVAQSWRTTAEKINVTSSRIGGTPMVPARLTDGLAKLADCVLRARSRAKAQAIARDADPHVRAVFVGLAEFIGDSNRDGVRGTARAHWQSALVRLERKFDAETTPSARRPLVTEYLATIARRDRQDEALQSARRSLLAVADAHAAFARGRSGDASGALGFILAELEHARELAAGSAQKL